MLVGPSNAFFMDNISNGLDSSTTAVNSHLQQVCSYLSSAASTRNLWALWWHYSSFRGTNCIPGTPWMCSRVFWIHGIQMSWEKSHCQIPIGVSFQTDPYPFRMWKNNNCIESIHCDSFPSLKLVTWIAIFCTHCRWHQGRIRDCIW